MLATDHAVTLDLIAVLPVLGVALISFMGLGLLIGSKLTQKKKLSDYLIVLFAYAFSALIGYIDFYIYLGSPRIGSDLNVPLLILNVLGLVYVLWDKKLRKIVLRRVVWLPLILVLLVGTLYIGVLASCTVHQPNQKEYYCLLPDTSQPSQALQKKIVFDTFDNLIPYYFAQNVENGHARLTYGNWKSSDRPPLQTGMYLAYSSATNWLVKDSFSSYLLLSMLFQLAAISAVYALLQVLKCNEKQISIIIFALIFTDFFFNNVYFTWPKLLAAALFLLGFLMFLEKKQLTLLRSVIIGASIAVAYLAHSAVAFSLVPLVIFVIPRIKNLFQLKYIAIILAAAALLIVPWSAYQRYYDPPGNRLLKWQFAGDIPIDNDSVTHDLIHAYESLTPKTYLEGKFKNVEMILATSPVTNSGFLKNRQVETLSGAGGLLIFSLIGAAFMRRRENKQGRQTIQQLSFYILSTLILWILLMFIPGSTALHQGSYIVPLMFIAILGIFTSFLPDILIAIILVLQTILFLYTWVFDKGLYGTTGGLSHTHALLLVGVLVLVISSILFLPLFKNRFDNEYRIR